MYKVVNLKQNSKEWLEWRSKKIGASDSNIIMGVSKFMTPKQLLEQKLNPVLEEEEKNTYITDKGHKVESVMIEYYRFILGCDDLKPLCIESKEHDILAASLDGHSESLNIIWEHKLVGKSDFEKVCNGEMLEQYKYQVQHQLKVSGADYCVFACTRELKKEEAQKPDFPYETEHLIVEPDLEIQAELKSGHDNFIDAMNGKAELGFHKNDVVDLSENDQLVELLSELQEIKAMESRKKEIEKELKKIAAKHKVFCNGVSITLSEASESEKIDYKGYIEENEILIPNEFKSIKKNPRKLLVRFPK